MRITFIIPGGGGGGVRSVLRIAEGLTQRGHQVRIFYRRVRGEIRDEIRRLYHAVRYKRGRGWLGAFSGDAVAYRELRRELVGRHDVLVGVGVDCVLEIAGLPDPCGIKVHNSRGVEPWRLDEMLRAWALPMPRIVVGSHLVARMREAGSRDPIYVAPNGVDARDYFPSLPETARDGVGVVYHGAGVKDPELILETLHRLAAKRPGLPFYVFSTFPDPGLLPRGTTFVRFPPIAAARDLYSRSLVWFMASRNEGFGNPLLEAASCGCALVSTDCGGATDIIEPGKSGLIVPVGDAAAIVAAIEQILDDETLRRQLAKTARTTALRFSWTRAIDDFENALLSIIELEHADGRPIPGIASAQIPSCAQVS